MHNTHDLGVRRRVVVHKACRVAEPSRGKAQRLARERLRIAQTVGVEPIRRGGHAIACLQENPKKPGTACNLRYEAYKSATTVAEFLEKGGTPADLTHDVGKGFVWYVEADDGRRPRGNQLLPVRLKNVRVLQCGRFAPTGPQCGRNAPTGPKNKIGA